jgi:hypothetical protein
MKTHNGAVCAIVFSSINAVIEMCCLCEVALSPFRESDKIGALSSVLVLRSDPGQVLGCLDELVGVVNT